MKTILSESKPLRKPRHRQSVDCASWKVYLRPHGGSELGLRREMKQNAARGWGWLSLLCHILALETKESKSLKAGLPGGQRILYYIVVLPDLKPLNTYTNGIWA